VKKLFKIVTYIVLGALALILLAAGVTQTQFFRDRVRAFALNELDSLLEADIYLGDVGGNLVAGFSVDSIAVIVDGTPFIVSKRLDLRYDLWGIPGKSIHVGSFELESPQIYLIRSSDGLWNFERMQKGSSGDTSSSGPVDWVITFDRLALNDGTILLIDSVALQSGSSSQADDRFIDYHSFTLTHFFLDLAVKLDPEKKELTFKSLRFDSQRNDLHLKDFSGTVSVEKDAARVRNLAITTSRSELFLDVEMKNIDLLGGVELERLQHSPVSLRIRESLIDLDELKKFIEELDFLHGIVSLDLEGIGEFGDLSVRKMNLATGKTNVHLGGSIANLHRPRDLFLKVKMTESLVSGRDVAALMPSFGIPEFRSVGTATLNLEFEGRPIDFVAKFLVETEAGNIQSSGLALSLGGPSALRYSGNLGFEKIDLARLVGNPDLQSSLNGNAAIQGQGISLETLASKVELSMDTSRIFDRPLRMLRGTVDAAQQTVSSTITTEFAESKASLKASLHKPGGNESSFEVNGDVANLNLQDFFHNENQNSDLTFSIGASGSNLTWEKLNGNFKLGIISARYRNYSLSSGEIDLTLDQRNPRNKSIILQSNIADLSIEGLFDIEYMADLIGYETQNIRVALGKKLIALDSTLAGNVDRIQLEEMGRSLAAADKSIDARFSLSLKDLVPVSVITSDRKFNGQGVLKGEMKGGYDRVALQGELQLNDFFYGNADAGILIDDGTATIKVNDLRPDDPLQEVEIQFSGDAKTLYVNRSRLDSVRLTMSYQQEYASYSGAVSFADNFTTRLQGLARVDEKKVLFTLNSLGVAYKDYSWQADGGASIAFNTAGVRVQDLVLRRDDQSVQGSGFVGIDGKLDATVDGKELDLDALRFVLPELDLRQGQKTLEGKANVNIVGNGTIEDPHYTATVHSNEVRFKGFLVGSIDGDFHFHDNRFETEFRIIDAITQRPQLKISGFIPLRLGGEPLPGEEQTETESIDLIVLSDGIQMSLLDPLLPTFDNLQGVLKCNLQLRGSLKKPDYSGFISVDSCTFLFVPNNIFYSFRGEFQPSRDRVKVLSSTLYNTAADNAIFKKKGEFHIEGDFSFRNLVPSDFRLVGNGQVLVVKRETRRSSLSVYGNLFVEIGEGGLSFTGPFQQPVLKGTVLVSNSTLIFPPTQEITTRRSEYYFPAVVVLDTTEKADRQWLSVVSAYYGTDDPYRTGPKVLSSSSKVKTLLDNVRYDLDIQASGSNTEIQMLFDPRTDEKLVATIVGKFSITEDGRRWIGNLSIPKASYTYLNKTFNASGDLVFTGDFLNPELKITATYEGTRSLGEPYNRTEAVKVVMDIAGTRSKPTLSMGMTIDGEEYETYGTTQSKCANCPKSGDVQTDAIVYILTGSFGTSQSQRNAAVADIGSSATSAVISSASSLFTQKVSDFLRDQTDFINAVEFRYGQGESFSQSAEVYVNLTLYKFLVKAGGRIFESIDKSNLSILYSLGDLLNSESLQNFMIEFEHKSDEVTSTYSRGQPVNSGRIFYRISF